MKIILFLFFGCLFVNFASAQLPYENGFAANPDEWLLSQGQKWHYRTSTASIPKQLNFREPKTNEKAIRIRLFL